MFIAEIGINHNGDLGLAKQLIALAASAGVDAVKFQKRNPDLCVPDDYKQKIKQTPWGELSYLEYRKRLEFGRKEYDEIDHYCRKLKLGWSASVWDLDSLAFMLKYDVPFLKVPGACLTQLKLLQEIRKTGLPVILSTGMSTEKEIDRAVKIFGRRYTLTICHCKNIYPAKDDEINLYILRRLQKKYPYATVGYSGHEVGIMPSILARALGAVVIERHITLDKKMWGSDQAASLNGEELKQLLAYLARVPLWLGEDKIAVHHKETVALKKLRY